MRAWITVALLLLAAPASAQPSVAELRARLAASPGDASLSCQLAYALVGESAPDEAHRAATAGIEAIARPLTARTRRTLGACLYNRGRASEALHRPRDAVRDFVASLALRPNDTVRARLDAIVPGVPASLPAAALAAFDDAGAQTYELDPGQSPRSVRAANGLVWHLVTARSFGPAGVGVVLIALTVDDEGVVQLDVVDDWAQEDEEATLSIASSRAVPELRDVAGVVLTVDATGGGNCGTTDGYADFEHHATVFVGLVDGRARSRSIITRQYDCDGETSADVRVRGADVVIARARGRDVPNGTHSIASLMR